MEDKKKDAYLYLIYKALVEIRHYSSIHNQIKTIWWNPFRWLKLHNHLSQINRLSDSFHNLPLYLKSDNNDFDEDSFWRYLEEYDKQYVTYDKDSFTATFTRVVEGEKSIKEETICPVCEGYYFEFDNDFDICPICEWENDGVQRANKDYWGGASSISVNESKLLYSLLQNDATKSKVSEVIDKYDQRQGEIHNQYADIDHRTSEGEKCHKAFTQAHNDFVAELYKLSE